MIICLDVENNIFSIEEGNERLVELYLSSAQSYENIEYICEDSDGIALKYLEGIKSDMFPECLLFILDLHDSFTGDTTFIEIYRPRNSSTINLQKTLKIDLKEWQYPFKPNDFIDRYIAKCNIEKYSATYSDTSDGNVYINITLESNEHKPENFSTMLTRLDLFIAKQYDTLIEKMTLNSKEDVLVKVFDFPENYQNICTQYLLWFGDFLKELGINADVHSLQNGTKTKIIVAPENAKEMLNEVEAMFYRYLSLPYTEILPAHPNSIECVALVSSLNAQISHFKTQIQMKDALLQLKDTTIGNLDLNLKAANEQLLLLSSLQDETIDIFEGAISIGDIQWGPLKISPSKLLRKLSSS